MEVKRAGQPANSCMTIARKCLLAMQHVLLSPRVLHSGARAGRANAGDKTVGGRL
jgi:hypothetical protein